MDEELFDTAIKNVMALVRTNVKPDEAVKLAIATKDLVEARRMWKLDDKSRGKANS